MSCILLNTKTKIFTDVAAAKSLQSCLTLYDPIDGSPPGSPIPGILQARTLEWPSFIKLSVGPQTCLSGTFSLLVSNPASQLSFKLSEVPVSFFGHSVYVTCLSQAAIQRHWEITQNTSWLSKTEHGSFSSRPHGLFGWLSLGIKIIFCVCISVTDKFYRAREGRKTSRFMSLCGSFSLRIRFHFIFDWMFLGDFCWL